MTSQFQFEYLYDDSSDVNTEIKAHCRLYDYANFNNSIFTKKFSHLNINRAEHKLDDFVAWLALLSYVPNVICLPETWFNDSSPLAILPNYKMHSVPRAKGMGGGVRILLSDINFTVLNFV